MKTLNYDVEDEIRKERGEIVKEDTCHTEIEAIGKCQAGQWKKGLLRGGISILQARSRLTSLTSSTLHQCMKRSLLWRGLQLQLQLQKD
jgi:hypothetical protein